MANASLPTNVSASDPGHIGHTNTVHSEVNELSRSTGRRNVSSYLRNGWTGTVIIWRDRNIVTLGFRSLDGSAATNPRFLRYADFPSLGWTPADNFESPAFTTDAGGNPDGIARVWTIQPELACSIGVVMDNRFRYVSWYCAQSTWPNPLPGTAV